MSELCVAMSMECADQKSNAVCLYERAATGLDISLGFQHPPEHAILSASIGKPARLNGRLKNQRRLCNRIS